MRDLRRNGEIAVSSEPYELLRKAESAMRRATPCYCKACNDGLITMFLCPTCGDKRCPHAEDHRKPCTGTNAWLET